MTLQSVGTMRVAISGPEPAFALGLCRARVRVSTPRVARMRAHQVTQKNTNNHE